MREGRLFHPAIALGGRIALPGDKSITHRAFLLGAVAHGTTIVVRPNAGRDCRGTLAALQTLGVDVAEEEEGTVTLVGRPGALSNPAVPLDLGNSGTGMRLLAGILAGRNVDVTLTGDASLSRRPMRRIVEPLTRMGGEVEALGAGGTPPLSVRGAAARGRGLTAITHESPIASAQVKSAVLLAGLSARGKTTVLEPARSRDHTERLLPLFGVPVERSAEGEGVAGPVRASVEGPLEPKGTRIEVPADLSAAVFWLVAGSLVPGPGLVLVGVGINPTRTGALDVLERMGARIERTNPRLLGAEPVVDLTVRHAGLVATDVEPSEIPALIDELPALAIAMAAAHGTSRVRGAGELRVKESDRIALLVRNLRAIGGTALEVEDGYDIEGGELAGGTVESEGDHRMAMTFGIAALTARGPVRVLGPDGIDTSYPSFYSDLRDRVTLR